MSEDVPVENTLSREEPSDATFRGKLYWFKRHRIDWAKSFARRHWFLFPMSVLFFSVLVFCARVHYQPLLLGLWKMSFLVLACCAILFIAWLRRPWKRFMHRSIGRKIVTVLFVVALFGSFVLWGKEAYVYTTLWYRYFSLTIVDLVPQPLTDYDRDLPRQVIITGIKQTMHDNSVQTTTPDQVRVGGKYGWSYAIVPGDRFALRLYGTVRKVGFVDATHPAPDFQKALEDVCFSTAENLLIGKNTKTATLWSLGFLQFFRYEPAETFYIKDDSGQWVQAVSLIKWTTFPFPIPEFGGVLIVPQDCDVPIWESTLRVFRGVGYYVPPEEISKHAFLKGQNILPYAVSTFIAESFRFQNGFIAPLLTHVGVVRIPVPTHDLNKQPYTIFYRFGTDTIEDSLQHSFDLEPWNKDLHGLSTSIYVPADGRKVVYRYPHAERGEAYMGSSAIGGFVRESRKELTWGTVVRDVEHRPYNKFVGGKRRPFYLTTVIALDPNDPTKFVASGRPDTVITYPITGAQSVWVDSLHPEKWVEELEVAYAHLWAEQ